ncbi:hypothetical protein ABFX02_08G174200 [Erythranthe guttata]
MGNCIRKESAMQWGGEDWGSFNSSAGGDQNIKTRRNENHDIFNYSLEEKTGLLLGGETRSSRGGVLSSVTHHHQVKVKISKKELEHLLKKADVVGLPLDEVFAQLMYGGDCLLRPDHQPPPWSPALQSIPE